MYLQYHYELLLV